MKRIQQQLVTLNKRSIEWTGMLERAFREFVHATEIEFTDAELAALRSLPDRLVSLVQSGVLRGVELSVGDSCYPIIITSDPNARDALGFSWLAPASLRGRQVELDLVMGDMDFARALGADALLSLSSKNLRVTLRSQWRSPS